jgi:hypothetical protein
MCGFAVHPLKLIRYLFDDDYTLRLAVSMYEVTDLSLRTYHCFSAQTTGGGSDHKKVNSYIGADMQVR